MPSTNRARLPVEVHVAPGTPLHDDRQFQKRLRDHRALFPPQEVVHLGGKKGNDVVRNLSSKALRLQECLDEFADQELPRLQAGLPDSLAHLHGEP